MNPDGLAAALLAQAEGSYAAEAAVGLLIEQRSWLVRADVLAFIHVATSFGDDRVLMAFGRLGRGAHRQPARIVERDPDAGGRR